MSAPASPQTVVRLLEVMARLRDPERGCPWDVQQSFASIAPYTIEEAYEVAEAIEHGDMAALKDELGDLLLQVVFHARMAEEAGAFDFADVAAAISDKMVRRHPHVFGEASFDSVEAQKLDWEAHKAAERQAKGHASALDGVAAGLPALTRAQKLQARAARVGFDWVEAGPVLDKIVEELGELRHEVETTAPVERLEDELGDLLFAVVNLARHLKVDPESALRRTNLKFSRRFQRMETAFEAEGRGLAETTLDEMEAAWQAAKDFERGGLAAAPSPSTKDREQDA